MVEEVCSGIDSVIEEGCWVGDWRLSRGVDEEDLIACGAVGRRGFGLPGLGSASVGEIGGKQVILVLALRVWQYHF